MTDKPDQRKESPRNPIGKTQKSRPGAKRDLGTVGGGTIPGDDADMQKGPDVSDSAEDEDVSANQVNKIDRHAHSNIGGRNPGQPRTAMGDQDSTRTRNQGANEDITDPMTSRAPHRVKQRSEQEDKK